MEMNYFKLFEFSMFANSTIFFAMMFEFPFLNYVIVCKFICNDKITKMLNNIVYDCNVKSFSFCSFSVNSYLGSG